MSEIFAGISGKFYFRNLIPDGQRRESRQPKEKSAGAKTSGVLILGGF